MPSLHLDHDGPAVDGRGVGLIWHLPRGIVKDLVHAHVPDLEPVGVFVTGDLTVLDDQEELVVGRLLSMLP